MEFFRALFSEPMAVVMASVAAVLAVVAVSLGVRFRDRLIAIALALISGMSAWMMATRYRW